MKKPKHITTSIDMDGSVAEVFLAKFNQLAALCEKVIEQNENSEKEIIRLNQKIDALQEPKIYSIHDLCRIFNVSPNTISKYIKQGLLPCCSEGQKVWFTSEQVNEFNRRTDNRTKSVLINSTQDMKRN